MSLLAGALAFVLTLGGAGAALYALQDRLIYFPDVTPPPPPTLLGLRQVSETRLRTDDGLSILAWSLPAARADAPVILYLHGNGGHVAYRAERARRFAEFGWGALFVQWRGYGANPGSPSEDGLAADAQAGLRALRDAGIAPARIVLWGESLGSGVAVRLAAEQPDAVGAVILESPYTSLLDLAHRHYPLLPSRLLLRDRYDSLSRIGAVRAPVLILHGARDTLVPPEMGRRLQAAATAPAELHELPQAGHDDIAAWGGLEEAAAFLGRRLRGRLSYERLSLMREDAEPDAVGRRLAERLGELRLQRGLSLDDLAAATGISRATLSRIERAEVSPRGVQLNRLCVALGWTLARRMASAEGEAPALVRAADQPAWTDPATGFRRRAASPPGPGLRVEVVEAELPAGAAIDYETPPVPGMEQHVLVLSGALEFSDAGESFALRAGDCARVRLRGPTPFRASGGGPARYIVLLCPP